MPKIPLQYVKRETKEKSVKQLEIENHFKGALVGNEFLQEPMLKQGNMRSFREADVRVAGVIRKEVNKKGEEILILHPTNIEIISPMRRGFS